MASNRFADRHPQRAAGGFTESPDALLSDERGRSELELATLAAAGDAAATARLLRALAPEMARVVRGVMGGNIADVDDALQQALVGLVQALPAFRGDCAPAGYACRIAFRTALRARRTLRARRSHVESLADEGWPSDEELPPERSESTRRMRLLRALLEDLPDEQAEALALRVVLGWTLEEIASATAAPVNTVRSRLRLAKEALRRRIEADPMLAERLGVER